MKTYDGVLSAEECRRVITKYEEDSRKVASTVSAEALAIDPEWRKGDELAVMGVPGWEEEDKLFSRLVSEGFSKYKADLGALQYVKSDVRDFKYKLQRTTKGDYYRWHTDETAILAQGRLYARAVTFILYLNEGFSGGRTQFFPPSVESVEPKTGRMLFFPANVMYPHQCELVSTGTKYIMTGWLYNPLSL